LIGILAILFIVLPFVDLWLLIRVAGWIEFLPTLALVIATGIGGAALAKRQGVSTIARIQQELAEGRMPTTELGEGVLILFAAAVLITPGFITDALGLALLVPPIRRLFLAGLTAYFSSRITVATTRTNEAGFTQVRINGFDDGSYGPPAPSDESDQSSTGGMKYVKNEAMNSPADDRD
jgi:UPF0716 protein FxsA